MNFNIHYSTCIAIASKDPKSVQLAAIAFSIHILLKSIIFNSISTLATSLTKSIT